MLYEWDVRDVVVFLGGDHIRLLSSRFVNSQVSLVNSASRQFSFIANLTCAFERQFLDYRPASTVQDGDLASVLSIPVVDTGTTSPMSKHCSIIEVQSRTICYTSKSWHQNLR